QGLLRQARHDFAGGLTLLGEALKHDPSLYEAHAWRAAIYLVQADYPAARRECQALAAAASELYATGCLAAVDAASGRAASAYAALRAALERHRSSPELRMWSETRLAEVAWRLGRAGDAERHFKTALATKVTDNYLLAAYADF